MTITWSFLQLLIPLSSNPNMRRTHGKTKLLFAAHSLHLCWSFILFIEYLNYPIDGSIDLASALALALRHQ